MKVKELIKALKMFDQNLDVLVFSEDGGSCGEVASLVINNDENSLTISDETLEYSPVEVIGYAFVSDGVFSNPEVQIGIMKGE